MRTLCLFGTAVLGLAACTQDYGQFGFGGGGTGASTSSSTTTSTTTGTASTTTTSSGGGEGGSGGATTSSTTSSGGRAGGAPPVVSVDCGGTGCAVEGTQACCWDIGSQEGSCESDGDCGGDVRISCQGPADCPGQICCADRVGSQLDAVLCRDTCSGGGDRPMCDPNAADPCANGTCTASMFLPAGYFICL